MTNKNLVITPGMIRIELRVREKNTHTEFITYAFIYMYILTGENIAVSKHCLFCVVAVRDIIS